MGLRLDGQLLKTEESDRWIVLLANHHYRCPATLMPVTLHANAMEQQFIPAGPAQHPVRIEEPQRGQEHAWYAVDHLSAGVYEAQSVWERDYSQRVWFRITPEHQIAEVSNDRDFALGWLGMAELAIAMGCGHTETLRLYGDPHRIGQARQQYQQANCRHCHREALYHAATVTNQALDCVPLQGTPKQIHWAERIRATTLEPMLAYEHQWDEFLGELEARKLGPEDAAYFLWCLKQQENARWWIEQRDLDLWGCFRYFRDQNY
jgi:hypothetical protein